MKRAKVTIVGAGMTGGTIAQRLGETGYIDVVLYDIVEGFPQGKALDLMQSASIVGCDTKVVGTNSWEETADSELVIITAGSPRKPGQSREDLAQVTAGIVQETTQKILEYSPDAFILVFTNPMDAMCHVALETSGLPRNRVFGQGGMLDTARFRTFIAEELNVSVEDVHAYVLGGHTDAHMVPIVSTARVGGIPLPDLLSDEKIAALVKRTKRGGAEILGLMKSGSAFSAPAAATVEMVESVLLDKKRVLPCSVLLQGEYGIHDAFVGVPVKLGQDGAEEILEMPLVEDELSGIREAARAVQALARSIGF